MKKNNFFISLKEGFNNIALVISEGKYKILLKPLLLGLVLCVGFYYAYNYTSEKAYYNEAMIDSLKTQEEQVGGYDLLKSKVLKMQGSFPDIRFKSEMLIAELSDIFNSKQIQFSFEGNPKEDSANGMLVSSINVKASLPFTEAGEIIAAIENNKSFLKVNSVSITKDAANLGKVSLNMTVSTVFMSDTVK
ncbi:hypothetical protein Dip518_000594 [Parelusimicrobium proximum]|uniref:hypothetical protein n=1 Tax=Parelusimicrobium proximum TaxID=3228953 RepID=UPI003D1699F6